MSVKNQLGTTVSSVAGRSGDVTLTPADVSLANVNNTSDASKPVSTATQTALNLKANTSALSTVATSGSYADLTSKPTIPTTAAQVGAVATTNLDSAVASNITTSGTSTQTALAGAYATTAAAAAKYTKPSNGIPITDLAATIQTQLTATANYSRVSKQSNTSITSSTTIANDPDLSITVAAGGKYAFELLIAYEADTAGDMKLELIAPSGCTIFAIGTGVASTNTATSAAGAAMTVHYVTTTNSVYGVAGGASAGVGVGYRLSGTLTTGSTAGTFGLAWAQNTSSTTATILYTGSELSVTKIG